MTELAAPFGQALPRIDGPDKVTGRALYGADHQPAGAAHAWQIGSNEIGNGTCTILAQTAAAILDLPVDRVEVVLGSSELPAAPLTAGSNSATTTLAEYLLATCADVAEVTTLLIPEEDPHINPLGMKGAGEIGATGVNAAIANAVFNATGVRVRRLPIRLDDLQELQGFDVRMVREQRQPSTTVPTSGHDRA